MNEVIGKLPIALKSKPLLGVEAERCGPVRHRPKDNNLNEAAAADPQDKLKLWGLSPPTKDRACAAPPKTPPFSAPAWQVGEQARNALKCPQCVLSSSGSSERRHDCGSQPKRGTLAILAWLPIHPCLHQTPRPPLCPGGRLPAFFRGKTLDAVSDSKHSRKQPLTGFLCARLRQHPRNHSWLGSTTFTERLQLCLKS